MKVAYLVLWDFGYTVGRVFRSSNGLDKVEVHWAGLVKIAAGFLGECNAGASRG